MDVRSIANVMSHISLYFAGGCALGMLVYWKMHANYLMFFLALPGTIVHELCHYLVALLTNSKPSHFTIFPKRVRGGWELGSVRFVPGVFSGGFVALAPLYLMPPIAFAAWWFSHGMNVYWQMALGYLAGLATGFMWPSSVDWKVAWYRPVGTILFFLMVGAAICYYFHFIHP